VRRSQVSTGSSHLGGKMLAWVVPLLMSLSTLCDSTASADLQLQSPPESLPAGDAYFMTCGPEGPALPQEEPDDTPQGRRSHYLRVTFFSCELSERVKVEHIVNLGRGCSRHVEGEYLINPRRDLSPLEYRVLGCGTHITVRREPEIVWVDSRTFEWHTMWSIIRVEHRGGSKFRVTVRAHSRS
jgi:hypothetical protein